MDYKQYFAGSTPDQVKQNLTGYISCACSEGSDTSTSTHVKVCRVNCMHIICRDNMLKMILYCPKRYIYGSNTYVSSHDGGFGLTSGRTIWMDDAVDLGTYCISKTDKKRSA